MPQPDLIEADRAEELPGHPDLGFRVGDGKDLLDEIARQAGVLLLHPVGENDVRGMARYPLSGIRWAEYSFSSAPRRYGAMAGCALRVPISSSGRVLDAASPS